MEENNKEQKIEKKSIVKIIWRNKKWWLVPIVLMALFFLALILFGQGYSLSPFVYEFG